MVCLRTGLAATLISATCLALSGHAQQPETSPPDTTSERVLFLFDSSNSMWGELADGSRKYEAGRAAMSAILDTGLGGRDIAFRAYGHRSADDCRDTELIVGFSQDSAAAAPINTAMTSIRPTGRTPITYSLTQSLMDLDGGPGEILLISDGIETCDADPCELMREWAEADVDVRVHVVGVGLNDIERQAMSCIAEETGGVYLDADSSEGFTDALGEVGDVIEASEPAPADPAGSQAIIIHAADAAGRTYRAGGTLYLNGEAIGDVTSAGYGRNLVDGPGEYEIEVGALLQDFTVYQPVRQAVTVAGEADTIVNVLVAPPARVTATFTEDGEPHPGAHVSAWKDGEEVFSFRASDEAMAAPGTYEFRTQINADNALSLTETLVEDTDTQIHFALNTTVRFQAVYRLPNGETFERNGELWQNGEKVYNAYTRLSDVRPGTYELRSDDQNLPLPPVEIDITTDGEVIEVPIDAGWVKITFAGPLYNYAREALANRAQLISDDRGGSQFSRPNILMPVTPGQYHVEGFDNDGFFDAPVAHVASGETVEIIVTPQPVGELVMTYAPSDNYERDPDRASITALEGQRIIGGILSPGRVRKFLPGRYRIEGYSYAGDIVAQEVTITAGERSEIVLRLRGE